MGMSIDKAVDRLEDLHFEQDNWEYEELTEDCLLNKEALRLAIDTMRKYQKIESKIKVLQHFTEDTPLATQRMIRIVNEIREVLENGSEDNHHASNT